MQAAIEVHRSELKSANEEKMKTGFKIDKLLIKIEEAENRGNLY